MRAMLLTRPRAPLLLSDIDAPRAADGQVEIEVEACGICRTDLHILDGELNEPALPLVPGHQIVGRVVSLGGGVATLAAGDRVGVPWLGWSCGRCTHCAEGRENLCDDARFTGYQIDGGFAERCVADARFAFPIPERYPPPTAAPLLCAGLIGYRAYRIAGGRARHGSEAVGAGAGPERLGIYGFGAAAHILVQLARHDGCEVSAFTRPGDESAQRFARGLGAAWAGGSDEKPPRPLDAAILFAPDGALVPLALRAVRKGGTVVCAEIHMSDVPSFPYEALWGERCVRSVANVTRADGEAFLALAPEIPIETTVHAYALEDANRALEDLRRGAFDGAAVVVP